MTVILRVLVFVTAALLAFQVLIFGRHIRANPLGNPPIGRAAFVLAKVGAAVSFLLLLLEAAIGPRDLPAAKSVLCACLLIGGDIIFALGMSSLGGNLRVGLPQEETALVTSGVYAYTRNPIYVGLCFILAASLLYAPSWLNLVAVVTTVVLHHRIILAEEGFLARHFTDYEAYRSRVRRYL